MTANDGPSNTSGEGYVFRNWFDGPEGIELDEEVLGLGRYGFTLSVFSSERNPEDPDQIEDKDAALKESWTAHFAYGR